MVDFKQYFKNKKITVMGLGLLGRGVGDAIFLAECGAKLIITDLKPSIALRPSLAKLRKFKDIKYVLGKHRLEDFRNCDMVLKAAGVPPDSIYVKEAKKNNIPVEMSAALFVKLSGLKTVGVTGTRGKSTVTYLIYHILKSSGQKVVLGGNIRGVSNLQLLKQVKNTETAVLELDSWQLQGFGESRTSPNIAVFTNFLSDHLNYYKGDKEKYFVDKSYIYQFQKKSDFLVLGPQMKDKIKNVKSKILNVNLGDVPKSWRTNLLGQHNKENLACAEAVARVFNIRENVTRKAVENFKPVSGRLEPVKVTKGISIYNDTNSTTPEALLAALYSFPKKVILIMGGTNKGLDVVDLNRILPQRSKKIFLLPGSGSDKIKNGKANLEKVITIKDAVLKAWAVARRGDIILFSPGFASFGMFNNEYDRGDQFIKIVKKLK